MRLHDFNTEFTWQVPQGPYRRISDAQARAFDADGFFVLDDAIDRAQLDELLAEIDPIEAAEETYLREKLGGKRLIARAGEITFTTQLALRTKAMRKLVTGPVFQDLCHDLIGLDARLYWDMAVYKKPGTTEVFPWHQDNGYTFVDPQQYLTCWIPLNDATLENGCPWVLPGAHKQGTFAHRATRVGLVCIEGEPEGRIAVPVRAGSIVVMSSLAPHVTGSNLSDHTRKALVAEFIPDGAGTKIKKESGEIVRTPCTSKQNMWVLQNGQAPKPEAVEAAPQPAAAAVA
jgi:ectoine hydroxylase-related dioxygenase (phytanoyl-CoA dioxygenase family)